MDRRYVLLQQGGGLRPPIREYQFTAPFTAVRAKQEPVNNLQPNVRSLFDDLDLLAILANRNKFCIVDKLAQLRFGQLVGVWRSIVLGWLSLRLHDKIPEDQGAREQRDHRLL